MLVIKSDNGNSYAVVPDNTGKQIGTPQNPCIFYPVPIARIPIGFGRTEEQAKELAHHICDLIESEIRSNWKSAEQWASVYGVRLDYKPIDASCT